MTKKSSTIAVRLLDEDKERFLRLAEKSGMTKREFIVALLDTWEKEWDVTKVSRN